MKKIKILSLILAVVCILPMVVACGQSNETVTNVTLKIKNGNGEGYLLDCTVAVKSETPCVLDAFEQACIDNDIEYTLNAEMSNVSSIGEFAETDEAFWEFTLNNKSVKTSAVDQAIAENDIIEFVYASL